MITAALIIGGILGILLVLLIARGKSPAIKTAEELQILVNSIDLQAFQNLINNSEDELLRVHLPDCEYRRVLRARNAAALAYVKVLAANAAALLRFAESAKLNADPKVAVAAEELAQAAIQMRIYSLSAMAKLYLAIVSPRLSVSPAPVERYQRMAQNLVHFMSLSQPMLTSRISESL